MLAKKIFVVAALALSLTACISQTPYQPLGRNGGYTQKAVGKDTYVVSFRGNNATSHQMVEKLFLRRAAELTVSSGYQYFVVTNKNFDVSMSTFSSPAPGADIDETRGQEARLNGGSAYLSRVFTVTGTVQMFHSNATQPRAVQASAVINGESGTTHR